tara:strand:+ start:26 stop:571 length:546 start_codon:yes stop_codon:yes gene_type:complete
MFYDIIILLLMLATLYLIIFIIKYIKKNINSKNNNELTVKSSFGYNSNVNDILLNPYAEPNRNDAPHLNFETNGIPINIKTQGCDAEYRQIGILTRTNGDETILPLMGRPLISNRDKWQFYTINDKNNSIKLPIIYKNMSCTCEYGCDNLYENDIVNVKGYNDTFKVSVYDNNTLKYIPYI